MSFKFNKSWVILYFWTLFKFADAKNTVIDYYLSYLIAYRLVYSLYVFMVEENKAYTFSDKLRWYGMDKQK
jgi:hypothetical protein